VWNTHPIIGSFDDGHTALLIAARNNQLEMLNELIAAGADVNAIEPVFGAVPLHKATYHGYEAVTQALANAAGIQLDYQGPSNGYTPLHDALWHGYPGCARILLAAGARKDLQAYDGKYPLDIAREEIPGDPIIEELKIP
jgi:ankyrin repeat protein